MQLTAIEPTATTTGPPSPARLAWRAGLVALDFWLFSSGPAVLGRFATTPNGRFLPATILLVAVNIVLVATWGRPSALARPAAAMRPGAEWRRWAAGAAALILAVVAARLLFGAARDWLGIVFTTTLDSRQGDMLPVIRAALEDLVRGGDPYAIHHVPWPVPLGYGPILWLPYLVPFALRADLRLVSVFGELLVPAACLATAVVLAARGRWERAAILTALGYVILSSGDLQRFTFVAHSPSYWPLLLLFSLLIVRGNHLAAAVVLGLLVCGRATMAAIVPVVLIAAWHRDRGILPKASVAFLAALVVPFLPFVLWDFGALRFGMVESYGTVVKQIVWPSADGGVLKTFGLTGFLLAHGWQRWVEPSQAIAMVLVYASAWRPLRRGASPLAWAALALLAFSMTSLWPVYYFYFDVFLLLTCAMVAEEAAEFMRPRGRVVLSLAGLAVAILLVGAVAANAAHPDFYSIDVGAQRPRWRLSGFGQPVVDASRRFCWVAGEKATIVLGRTTRRRAVLRIDCRPFLPSGSSSQTLQPVVNGVRLEKVVLAPDWSSAVFRVPPGAWQIGLNRVELFFGYAISPRDAGLSPDPQPRAAAVEHVAIDPAGQREGTGTGGN